MAEDPAVRGGRKGGKIGGPKGGEASLHSENVSAAQLAQYMKGIDFPVGRQALIDQAKANNAPERVMQFMNQLPEREYHYPTDVEEEFGKLK